MELLLLIGAVIILGIWVCWQEYRINKIREELDRNTVTLKEHAYTLYGGKQIPHFIYKFFGVSSSVPDSGIVAKINHLEKAVSQQKQDNEECSRKEAMAKYISCFNHLSSLSDDDAADILYRIAHGEEEDK